MEIKFTISKTRQTLERQWAYIVKRNLKYSLDQLKMSFAGMFLITGTYLLFNFFTAPNNYISPKVVLLVIIAVGWCVVFIRIALIGFGKLKDKRSLNRLLDSISEVDKIFNVQIDEEKITIGGSDNTEVYPWHIISWFGAHTETLYLINNEEAINSIFLDRSEIGDETFTNLLLFLKQKQIKQAF